MVIWGNGGEGGCEWECFERDGRVVVVGTYKILVTVLFTFNASPMLAAPAGPMSLLARLLGCGNLGQGGDGGM